MLIKIPTHKLASYNDIATENDPGGLGTIIFKSISIINYLLLQKIIHSHVLNSHVAGVFILYLYYNPILTYIYIVSGVAGCLVGKKFCKRCQKCSILLQSLWGAGRGRKKIRQDLIGVDFNRCQDGFDG